MNLDDDAKLGRLLRDDERTYIDDAGFTARVLADLPPARRTTHRRRRAILVGGSAALSSLLVAIFAAPALDAFVRWGGDLMKVPVSIAGFSFPLTALMLTVLGCALAAWTVRGEFRS